MFSFLEIVNPQFPQYANFQEWLQDTSYYEMILKGLIIGIVASAPMGPVGILCVQRTINKGRWEGFATGVGASISDLMYAIITGIGVKFVTDPIENPVIAIWVKSVGGVLLFLFGIYTFFSKPKETTRVVHRNKGTLLQNMLTGFAVTVSNPLIIILFTTMFSMFTFIITENFIAQLIGYLFIVVGALAWWYGLTWLVDKVRNSYNIRIVWILNRAIGIAVMIGAVLYVLYTVTGHAINLSEFRFPIQ